MGSSVRVEGSSPRWTAPSFPEGDPRAGCIHNPETKASPLNSGPRGNVLENLTDVIRYSVPVLRDPECWTWAGVLEAAKARDLGPVHGELPPPQNLLAVLRLLQTLAIFWRLSLDSMCLLRLFSSPQYLFSISSTCFIHGVKLPGLIPCLLLTSCMILNKLPSLWALHFIHHVCVLRALNETAHDERLARCQGQSKAPRR